MTKAIKVGYSLSETSLGIAVAHTGGNVTDLRLSEVPLPVQLQGVSLLDFPDEAAQFLHEATKQLKIPGGAAGLCLPYGVSLCRFLTMPLMTEKQVLLNLPFEFSDFIQGNADDYYFDYAMVSPVDEPEDTLALMAATALKANLEGYQEVFKRAGINLRVILPPAMALINVARRVPDADVCFVNVEAHDTRITVVHNDRVQATREIAIGCADFTEEAAAAFGVELLKILNFYQFTYSANPLRGIYLIGEGAASEAVLKAAEQAIDLPLLPISELLPLGGSGAALAAGVCLGGE